MPSAAAAFLTVPWLYQAVTLAGAVYLLHLAWQAVRPGGAGWLEARVLPPYPAARLFGMGLLTNLLNPKAAIMYLALIPQFIAPRRGRVLAQGLTLGSIQMAVSATVNAVVVLAAAAIAAFLATRPGWLRCQRLTTGILLAAVAIHLALAFWRR